MLAKLSKPSIDLGIVVRDAEAMVAFYRDLLGFELEGEVEMPGLRMVRLLCGDSVIKLVKPDTAPEVGAPPGGIFGATGVRYWTLAVDNLDEIADACTKAGCAMPVKTREARPGVRIFIVEDPDGNWVEFAEYA